MPEPWEITTKPPREPGPSVPPMPVPPLAGLGALYPPLGPGGPPSPPVGMGQVVPPPPGPDLLTEAMQGAGRGLAAGLGKVLETAQRYTEGVVQPLWGSVMLPEGREAFGEGLATGEMGEGWRRAGEAWRQSDLPGWLKFGIETVGDPLNLLFLGPFQAAMKATKILAPVAMATEAYDRAVSAGLRAGAGAARGVLKEAPVVGGLFKPSIRQEGENFAHGILALTLQRAGAAAVIPQGLAPQAAARLGRRRTAQIMRYFTETPAAGPDETWLRQHLLEQADKYVGQGPEQFLQNLGRAAARAKEDELRLAIKEKRAGGPITYRLAGMALNGIDAAYQGLYRRGLERYFVAPLTASYLTFFNFPPMNAVEEVLRHLTGKIGLGMVGPAEFVATYGHIPMSPEALKLYNNLAYGRAYAGFLPGAERMAAIPGGTFWERLANAVKVGWSIQRLGPDISEVVVGELRRNAFHQFYTRRLLQARLFQDPAFDAFRAAVGDMPAELAAIAPKLQQLVPHLVGTKGFVNMAAGLLDPKVLSSKVAGEVVTGFADRLSPRAYSALLQQMDAGITRAGLEDLKKEVLAGALDDLDGMTDPAVLAGLSKEVLKWLGQHEKLGPDTLPGAASYVAQLHDSFWQAFTAQPKLAASHAAGLTDKAQAAIHNRFAAQQARLHDEILPLVEKVRQETLARLPPGQHVGWRTYLENLESQSQLAERWWLKDKAVRERWFTAGKRPKGKQWQEYYGERDQVWLPFQDERIKLAQAQRKVPHLLYQEGGQYATATATMTAPPQLALDDMARGNIADRTQTVVDELFRQLDAGLGTPVLADEAQGIARNYLGRIAHEWNLVPEGTRSQALAARLKLGNEVVNDFRLNFPLYTDEQALDVLMRFFFPFWRYEAQRWVWLPTQSLRYPGLVTAYARYMNGTEDGYIPLPEMPVAGEGLEVNPLRGTILGAVRRMAQRDFPPPATGALGNILAAQDLMARGGFYLGPHFTAAIQMLRGGAEKEMPQLGEVQDPISQSFMAMAQMVPGLGGPMDAFRTTFLGDRFREYQIRRELARLGVDPDKATPQERERVLQKVGFNELLEAQLALTRYRPDAEQEYRRSRGKAYAEVLGVPEEDVKAAFREGKRPESLWSISPAQREAIQQKLKQYEVWNAVSLPLRSKAEQQMAEKVDRFWSTREAVRTLFAQGTREQLSAAGFEGMTSQAEDDALLEGGQLTGEQWRERRSRRQQQLGTSFDTLRLATPEVPVTEQERATRYPQLRLDRIHPVREALNEYYSLTPDAFMDAKGVIDWDAFLDARDALLRSYPPDVQSEVQEWLVRRLTPTEKEYAQARETWRDYRRLPRYVNIPAQWEDAVSETSRAAATLRQYGPATPRELLLVEAARRLGYPPLIAYLAQVARPNPQRQMFRVRHPELAKFYGAAPVGG